MIQSDEEEEGEYVEYDFVETFFFRYSLTVPNNCVILKFRCKTLRGSIHPKKHTDSYLHIGILVYNIVFSSIRYTEFTTSLSLCMKIKN